jgi:hypothetical protein
MWYEDDDDDDKSQEETINETGNYDLGDDIGTRIGEHEEDPAV